MKLKKENALLPRVTLVKVVRTIKKKRFFIFFNLFFINFLSPTIVYSQNSENDLLNEFDSELDESQNIQKLKGSDDDLLNELDNESDSNDNKKKKIKIINEESKGVLSQFDKNLSGSLRARYYYFFNDVEYSYNNSNDTDDDQHYFQTLLKL